MNKLTPNATVYVPAEEPVRRPAFIRVIQRVNEVCKRAGDVAPFGAPLIVDKAGDWWVEVYDRCLVRWREGGSTPTAVEFHALDAGMDVLLRAAWKYVAG